MQVSNLVKGISNLGGRILILVSVSLCSCSENDPGSPAPVEAKFTSVTFVKAGADVQFTDESTGVPTSWEWTFEGGSPETSSSQNPTVNYPEPGFYKVILKASKEGSTDTEVKTDYLTVGCNGDYCDPTFNSFVKTTGIVYGIDENQHKLNLYEPASDESLSRPLVILFGGGAFSGSNMELLESVADELTKYGFVVASARYRNGPSNEGQQNFIRGQQDLNAAVRYFRKEAAQWKIDPAKIFVGGNGTGGFLALNHSYLDLDEIDPGALPLVNSLGGWEGSQGNEGFSSSAIGCFSLAAGLYSPGTIDFIKNEDVPLFAVHGNADAEVPIGTTSSTVTLYGSQPVVDKVKAVGLLGYLYTIDGGGHDAPRSNPTHYMNQLITWCHLVMNP